jgi:hypothetical protein
MSTNNYSFDEISLPNPPTYVEGQPMDYVTVKLPTFLRSQYIALLDFISAVQSGFLINSSQIISLDADKITNNTQFTQSLFVGAESKIKLDGVNNQITITDSQGTPVTRVILGKLSGATNDYGVKVVDAGGTVKFQTGATTFIDGGIITANTVSATQIAADTITADQMAANSITADEIASNAVTAAKINVSTLSAVAADMGTLTAGTITGGTVQTAASGARVVLTTNGMLGYKADGTNTIHVQNDGQFRFGPASGDRIVWNNSALQIVGDIVATGNIEDGAITVPTSTTGSKSANGLNTYPGNLDLTVSTRGGNVIATIAVDAIIRGTGDVGTANANLRVQIDGNTFKNTCSFYATSGGGSAVTAQTQDGNTCTGTFLDGNPAGSLDSAADTTYTVIVDVSDNNSDLTATVISYNVKLVTLETFK